MKSVACVVLAALLCVSACDPVIDQKIAALPGEQPGVRPGPRHRAGQPCLLCHDGELGDPREFSVAGTVYERQGTTIAAGGATVSLTDSNGNGYDAVTNDVGNFYISPFEFKPVYPLQVDVHYRGERATMRSVIGRDGACATCHADPASAASPGHVYVALDDGGVPP
jgi:hypothetical protein